MKNNFTTNLNNYRSADGALPLLELLHFGVVGVERELVVDLPEQLLADANQLLLLLHQGRFLLLQQSVEQGH